MIIPASSIYAMFYAMSGMIVVALVILAVTNRRMKRRK